MPKREVTWLASIGVRRNERTTLSPPGVVELVGAVVRSEADHRDSAFPEMELAREQSSRMGDLAVAGDLLLQQHGELLAFLQFALEVDVVGERPDELEHRLRG